MRELFNVVRNPSIIFNFKSKFYVRNTVFDSKKDVRGYPRTSFFCKFISRDQGNAVIYQLSTILLLPNLALYKTQSL